LLTASDHPAGLVRRGLAAGQGERIRVIPCYACNAANLHDEIVALRRGKVEAIWPILARGKVPSL
jgi:D-serine deaminase-like pyridoxal phosphate-dependent protein